MHPSSSHAPLVIAVDTSSTSLGIALFAGGTLRAETILTPAQLSSRILLVEIDHLLKIAEISLSDITFFAACAGPGSFTGLRVGMSTIQGLAWTLNKPALGISSLMALAAGVASGHGYICPVMDARKKEVYGAIYESQHGVSQPLCGPAAYPPTEFIALMQNLPSNAPILLLGSGTQLCLHAGQGSLEALRIHIPPLELHTIRPAIIARLALDKYAGLSDSQRATWQETFIPLYCRRSEAEINYPRGALGLK